MCDIMILALNSKYIHSSLAPWYLKSAVASVTDSCIVAERTVNEDYESILSQILLLSPKILAVSVYIWNVEYLRRFLPTVKESLPDVKIVLGGPEVSYNPKDVLSRFPEVDYVISGEGERPFFDLCDHLLRGKPLDGDGISFRNCGENFISRPYIGNDTPATPYTEDYFAALCGRIAYFESSRGCPYSCAYCLSGRSEGLRFFDIEYVKENLVKLASSGTRTVKFVDRTFNADRARAKEIWSFLINESGVSFKSDVCFHFELSGDLIDSETLELLKKAPEGLFQFEIGIQSFCDKTIDCIHRVTDSEKLKSRIKELVAMGNAHIHTDLIAGLPYEDISSFAKSFNEAYILGADMLQLGFLKILHGTELEERAKEFGFKYSPMPPYEVFETPWLSKSDFLLLKTVENAVDRIHNSGKFRRTLDFCIRHFDSPFDFFLGIGERIKGISGLDALTDCLYVYLCERLSCDNDAIRDVMVLDRIATNSSKKLPVSLCRNDPAYAAVKNHLNASCDTAQKRGVRRSIAILRSRGQAVYADYIGKSFKGEYKLHLISLGGIDFEKN